MKAIYIILFLAICGTTFFSKADSPLTSTHFSEAYVKNKWVKRAAEGKLNKKTLKYLCKSRGDDAVKIAMINEIGWQAKGQVVLFETYLLANNSNLDKGVFDELRAVGLDEFEENERTLQLSADDLMCWAYLQALDDYFKPQKAYAAASLAYDREPKSMAHATVYALITAQIVFDSDWCGVYKTGKLFFIDEEYESAQLSPEAVRIIMDYLDLYKDSCK